MPVKQLEIPPLRIGKISMTLVGDTVLVTNCFHDAIIEEIVKAQEGKAKSGKKGGKPPKVPNDNFMRSLHVMPGTQPLLHDEKPEEIWAEGHFGFPAIGIKQCAVSAANDCGMEKTFARRAFHIDADLCEIQSKPGPYMRRDWVKPQFNVTDIAFRGEFREWSIPILVSYNKDLVTMEQVVNLFFRGGYSVGIGAFRPERDGNWGRFHVGKEISES